MLRNKQSFYEAKVTGVEMGQNGDGEYTEETKIYSTPDEHNAVISPASGSAELQAFGANEVYDKVITLEKGENYLAVGSLLWIDCPIELDTNGDLAIDENGTPSARKARQISNDLGGYIGYIENCIIPHLQWDIDQARHGIEDLQNEE
jgi:hypothetical protein